jgi:hypothetical protein
MNRFLALPTTESSLTGPTLAVARRLVALGFLVPAGR